MRDRTNERISIESFRLSKDSEKGALNSYSSKHEVVIHLFDVNVINIGLLIEYYNLKKYLNSMILVYLKI